jgi:hypothetical protein
MRPATWLTVAAIASAFANAATAAEFQATTTVHYGQSWLSKVATVRHARVLAVQDNESGRLDIGIRINTGYFSEPGKIAGLAHLAEHLIANGHAAPFAEPLHVWANQGHLRQLHCQTFGDHSNCFASAEMGEAADLMRRVAAAFARKEYSVTDYDRQLQDIGQEYKRFAASDSGVVNAFESKLADPLHPLWRNFASSGDEAMTSMVRADLTNAARTFLEQHYWGHQADIVIIGPWPPNKTLALARRYLLAGFSVAAPQDASIAPTSVLPFESAQTAAWHESRRPAADDLIVLAYALPISSKETPTPPGAFRAFDLLQFNLQDTDPRSLYSEFSRRFHIHSLWIDATPGKFGNADSLRIEIERAPGSVESAAVLQDAIVQYIHRLGTRPRAEVVEHYQSVVGLSGLIGPRPSRDGLVFDALDELDSGRSNGAFDYAVDVDDRAWTAYRTLLATVAATTPLRVLFHGTSASISVTADRASAEPEEAPPAPEHVPLDRISAAAGCIASYRSSTHPCLGGLWSVDGIRSNKPFDTALQRTIAQALLAQTQRLSTSQMPELAQYGNSLEVSAGATPAIGLAGHFENPRSLLQRTWHDFLRKRTEDELGDIARSLAYTPGNAFDWSMDAASDGLAITDHSAARHLVANGNLKEEVHRLQEAFHDSITDHYDPRVHRDFSAVPAKSKSSTPSISVNADVTFVPGTALDMHCVRPTEDVMTFLRLVTLPSHQFMQNAGRATGDPDAFGAYVVREWGAEKCFGESMDSGILDSTQLRATVSALATQREQDLCALSRRSLSETKRWVLATEDGSWANEQAYAIQDLRNWMQFGPGMLPAREISRRAAALSTKEVCSWLRRQGATPSNVSRSIEIVVPRTH